MICWFSTAIVASGSGVGVASVQAANSQFGPVRPTDVPSGQIFASMVQAFEIGTTVVLLKYMYPTTNKTISARMPKAQNSAFRELIILSSRLESDVVTDRYSNLDLLSFCLAL